MSTPPDDLPINRVNVIKKMFQFTAVLVTLFAAATGFAQEASGAYRRPAVIACEPPQWAPEAMRYELEGTTILQFDVDDEGRPTSIQVVRKSGWKILDHMAVSAMEGCRFEATSDPLVVRTGLRAPYNWKLEDNEQRPVPAALVAGSCKATENFGGFIPVTGKLRLRTDGLLVRFLLDEAGHTFGIKLEETHSAPVTAATEYIKSCRFTPATLDGKPIRGNLQGWLTDK